MLTIKLRKSPFDLSMSHHAHQEIVRGVTTEMSGPTLAKVEIMHWAENVLFLSWTAIFFVWANPASIALAVVVGIVAYFLEVFIDNNFGPREMAGHAEERLGGRPRARRHQHRGPRVHLRRCGI